MEKAFATLILAVLIGCASQQQNPLVGSWRAPDGSLLTFSDDYTISRLNAQGEVSKSTYAFIDAQTVRLDSNAVSDPYNTFTFSIDESVLKTKQKNGELNYFTRVNRTQSDESFVKPKIKYDGQGREIKRIEYFSDNTLKSTTTTTYKKDGNAIKTVDVPRVDGTRTETTFIYSGQSPTEFKTVREYDTNGKLVSEKRYSNPESSFIKSGN